MGAGAKLEVVEQPDGSGLTLRVVREIERVDVAALAGMAKARSSGRPRSLENFDPASLLSDNKRLAKAARRAGLTTPVEMLR